MKCIDDLESVLDSVEEIRIAEGDVLRAGGHLAADVFHDDVAAHDAENAFVDGHDRAVAAEMFATAAGLRGADDAVAVAGDDQICVVFERWKSGAIGDFEGKTF